MGLDDVTIIESSGPCECFCLLEKDSKIFFPSVKGFDLSLSQKYNFIFDIPFFQDINEESLINLALGTTCKELKIRSTVYQKG